MRIIIPAAILINFVTGWNLEARVISRWNMITWVSVFLHWTVFDKEWATPLRNMQFWYHVITKNALNDCSRAQGPLAPNFWSWATRKSYFFCTNLMLNGLDFTGSEHWAPFNSPKSTALLSINGAIVLLMYMATNINLVSASEWYNLLILSLILFTLYHFRLKICF